MPTIPIIENIHQRIFDAASQPKALNMYMWHENNENHCGTTHCRAGWAVHLAGELGYALEKATSTDFAAMQIYKASSPIEVHLHQFFVTNEEGLADMERCAKEEAAFVNE